MRIQSRPNPDAHRNPFAELKGRTRPRLANASNAITIYSLCLSLAGARDKIAKRESAKRGTRIHARVARARALDAFHCVN